MAVSKDESKLEIEKDFAKEIVIDSTAPLEKVLRSLLHREHYSKAYRFYRHLLVQRRIAQTVCINYHFTVPGHPLKVFESDWDGEISPDYFEQFPYRSTMPKVITPMRNIQETDPVTDYIKVKSDWNHELVSMKRNCTKISKHVRRLNEDVMQVPKCLIDLAAMIEKDPDENFDATYNWYYAGNGSMQLVCINWVDYLLHSEFSVLYLTRIHKDITRIENEPTSSFNCETENILETICSSQNVVALRTKHKIVLLKIIENDNEISFEKIKQFESEIPFTSITFDKYHTNILYATTLDSKLKIVNIDRVKARSVTLDRHNTTNVNNWNCVIGGERGSYAHVEARSVTFYDKRTNDAVSSWTGLRQIVDEIHCNDILAAARCDDSPSLYFATDHHVFLMDTRCVKNTRPRPAMRWTHGLQCAPAYLTIGRAEQNRDLIVVSSQWCEDTCVVCNHAEGAARACALPGVSVPYHPPGLMDVLNEARLKMLCCDIANPIERRLVTAVTGQVLFEQGENTILLTHNSLGDITQRTLFPHYMESFVEDDSCQELHEWSREYKLERAPFEVSKIVNIANVWRKLKRVPEGYDLFPKSEDFPFDEDKMLQAFTNSELMPELLDAWEGEKQGAESDGDESFALNLHFEDSI